MKEFSTDTSIPEDVAGDQICYHGDKAGELAAWSAMLDILDQVIFDFILKGVLG